jgi:ABC-type Zn2+ transport system substrate-binding protein/surface adhesin
MLKLSRSPVVVAFDKVDCPAGQTLSIGGHTLRSSEAEIPEKIKDIAWLGASVDTFADHIVHLLRIRKRAIAVPNDVEVAEMKIGREPDIAHGFILVDLRAQRHRL